MHYTITTTDAHDDCPPVRVIGPDGNIVLAEVWPLFADHPRRIACDLAVLVRKQEPSARVIVDGEEANLFWPTTTP
jgi:hypothetical protein